MRGVRCCVDAAAIYLLCSGCSVHDRHCIASRAVTATLACPLSCRPWHWRGAGGGGKVEQPVLLLTLCRLTLSL